MSLSKHKMDKLIEAVVDKGYSRYPASEYDFGFLFKRMMDEIRELTKARGDKTSILKILRMLEVDLHMTSPDEIGVIWKHWEGGDFWLESKRELADISNFIDFLYDRLLILELKYKEMVR